MDPVEGTSYLASGQTNALAVLAVAPRGTMMNPAPAFYMEKFVAPAPARGKIDPHWSTGRKLRVLAEALNKDVSQLTIYVLEKPRHRELIEDIIRAGARVALYPAGDVAGALLAAIPGSGIDALMGTGGTPEGVMSACAMRGLGGEFLARIDPQLHTEAKAVREAGISTSRWYDARRADCLRQCVFLRHGHHHRPDGGRGGAHPHPLQGSDHDGDRGDGRAADHHQPFSARPLGPGANRGARRCLKCYVTRENEEELPGVGNAEAGRAPDHFGNRRRFSVGQDDAVGGCRPDSGRGPLHRALHRRLSPLDRRERGEKGLSAIDPRANYLDILEQALRHLREGEPILKPVYDHRDGTFGRPKYVKPKEFVIAEGLLGYTHAGHARLL